MTVDNVQFQTGYLPGSATMDAMGEEAEPQDAPLNPLDSDANEKLFERLKDWYEEEIERQRLNRFQMALDCDYYDGLQISEEDYRVYEDRGQAPLVFNRIALSVNWILGTEVKTRFDWSVRPRNKQDVEIAPIKTDLLKYLSDVNRAGPKRSAAFKDQVVAGLGWLEVGITVDPSQEMIFVRSESWRNVIYDSRSVVHDMSDARFLFRHRWVDLDVAQQMFPDRAEMLKNASRGGHDEERSGDNWFLGENLHTGLTEGDTPATKYYAADTWSTTKNRRLRVRLIEAWYRQPGTRKVMRGEHYDGQTFDPTHPGHSTAILSGYSSVVTSLTMQMQTAIFCDLGLLSAGPMPYKHNKFPLVPLWCYRRDRDHAPYGMVRAMRDPQDDYNKRLSKSLFLMSVNRVLFEEGAFGENEDEAREELSRPDAFQSKKRGKEVEITNGSELSPPQMEMANISAKFIETASGVTDEAMGRETNAISGKAIGMRSQQGTITTATIFDRYREGFELQGQLTLSLAEQYYSVPRVIRITGPRNADKFLQINQRDPSDPLNFLNDITKTEADFVVDEQDARATTRQALFEQVVALLATLAPQEVPKYIDIAFDLLDIPQAEGMAKRARMLNGMDPLDGPSTPDEVQAAQQRQQAQQFQQMMLMRSAIAGVVKLEAEAKKIGAQTAQISAQALLQGMTTIYEAMQSGQILMAVPGVAPAGDELLKAIGFQDQAGPGIAIPYPTTANQPPQPGQPGQPQQQVAPPVQTPQPQPMPQVQPPGVPVVPPTATLPTTDIPKVGQPPHAGPPHDAVPHPMQAAGAKHGIETLRTN